MQTRYFVRWHNNKASHLLLLAGLLSAILLSGCKLPQPKAGKPVANSVPSSPTALLMNSSSGVSSTESVAAAVSVDELALEGDEPEGLDNGLDGIVPPPQPVPVVAASATKVATPRIAPQRTQGINVNPAADPYRGVLAICSQPVAAKTQPDWYMPGYQRIGQRLCDGQWVTCGNTYPCAAPTPKDGDGMATGYGYEADTGQGLDEDQGSYDYYYAPKH